MVKETPAEVESKYSIAPYREGEYLNKGPLYLYAPTSYKPSILLGGKPESSVALVTGWSDPQSVASGEVLEEIAVAASIRTPVGVQLMLSNLARNPHIRKIVRRAVGSTNNTDRGRVTKDIVDALFRKEYDEHGNWKSTVDDEGNIVGTQFKLRHELTVGGGIAVVREVLKNVELIDLNDKKNPSILEEVRRQSTDSSPYFPLPVNFPEFEPIPLQTWSSERFGITVRGTNAFDTWIELVDKVVRYGKPTTLESALTGHIQLKDRPALVVRELPFVMAILDGNNPFPEVPKWAEEEEALTLSLASLENYYIDAYRPETHKKEIFPGVSVYEKDNKYKYGEEMHMYPNNPAAQKLFINITRVAGLEVANRAIQEGVSINKETQEKIDEVLNSDLSDEQKAWVLSYVYYPQVDQYQIAVDRLKVLPDDADKVIMFYNPVTHGQLLSGRPCLNRIGILAREGYLHALSEFRTHDSKSWLENVYGVWRTVQDMAKETNFKVGKLITVSDSLHVYQQDQDWLVRLWQEQFCDQEVSTVFDDNNADPRGDISVTLVDGSVKVSLLEPVTGDTIAELEARSNREAVAQLSRFGWTSQPNHALYIGGEIMTALLAKEIGVEFVQDQPQRTRRAIKRLIN